MWDSRDEYSSYAHVRAQALTQKLVTIENIHVFILPCANKLTFAFKKFQHCILVTYLLACSSAKRKQVASGEETSMFVLTPI